jgi:hypothetical protein
MTCHDLLVKDARGFLQAALNLSLAVTKHPVAAAKALPTALGLLPQLNEAATKLANAEPETQASDLVDMVRICTATKTMVEKTADVIILEVSMARAPFAAPPVAGAPQNLPQAQPGVDKGILLGLGLAGALVIGGIFALATDSKAPIDLDVGDDGEEDDEDGDEEEGDEETKVDVPEKEIIEVEAKPVDKLAAVAPEMPEMPAMPEMPELPA